jgi:hypothetical protein
MVPFRTLLAGNLNPVPKEAAPWVTALKKYAPIATASTAAPVKRNEPVENEKSE